MKAFTAVLVGLFMSGAYAAEGGAGHNDLPRLAATSVVHPGEGTVKEIKDGKIKLEHGPIQSLRWGGMTMFFTVESPDLLKNIRPGDKVRFELIEGANGQYIVTKLTVLPR